MRKVLIVDDDKELLESLRKELIKDRSEYEVEFVSNGREALSLLEKNDYDLLITDINMPEVDGVQLVAELLNRGKWTHVLVASGEGTMRLLSMDRMKALEKFGVLNYIFKPYLPGSLRKIIRETLHKLDKADTIAGISLPTVAQMMELEDKTGVMKVKGREKEGKLFFISGRLVDAQVGSTTGEKAAIEIFSWNNVTVEIEYIGHRRERNIKRSLGYLILEAAKMKDEK